MAARCCQFAAIALRGVFLTGAREKRFGWPTVFLIFGVIELSVYCLPLGPSMCFSVMSCAKERGTHGPSFFAVDRDVSVSIVRLFDQLTLLSRRLWGCGLSPLKEFFSQLSFDPYKQAGHWMRFSVGCAR